MAYLRAAAGGSKTCLSTPGQLRGFYLVVGGQPRSPCSRRSIALNCGAVRKRNSSVRRSSALDCGAVHNWSSVLEEPTLLQLTSGHQQDERLPRQSVLSTADAGDA
ncbi:hypothetical protein WJX77_008547 [Trebouxia sp. C0004]